MMPVQAPKELYCTIMVPVQAPKEPFYTMMMVQLPNSLPAQ